MIHESMKFIADRLTGSAEDWLDAIEALGVRDIYYNGAHCAYLGHQAQGGTNAAVARFETREECQDWCRRVNERLGPFD